MRKGWGKLKSFMGFGSFLLGLWQRLGGVRGCALPVVRPPYFFVGEAAR